MIILSRLTLTFADMFASLFSPRTTYEPSCWYLIWHYFSLLACYPILRLRTHRVLVTVIFIYLFFAEYLTGTGVVQLLCGWGINTWLTPLFGMLMPLNYLGIGIPVKIYCFLFIDSILQSSQGDQKSPGIIPLAIKDVFSIIQDVSASVHKCLFNLSFIISIPYVCACNVCALTITPTHTYINITVYMYI